MLARALTHALVGLEPRRVDVEAQVRGTFPSFVMVGLADRACQEAKQRVRSAFASVELQWPPGSLVVNLAPAHLKKEGTSYDLAIALAIAASGGAVSPQRLAEHACVGELSLDGRVRPVAGALAVAEGARRAGCRAVLCAAESAREVELAGVVAVPLRHLGEAVVYLKEGVVPEPPPARNGRPEPPAPDLADVRGQERARRALELAAAGSHNLLLAGPPGAGKTMLARRLPGVLPPLGREESLEVTRIHSVAGMLAPGRPLVERPPFRAPHHTASAAAIVGGGRGPRPGEASLAHRGVLLLDELPEFQRPVLEALRQPLEDGVVSVARAEGRATFPARFQVVATMNLCPCGGRGDAASACSCSPQRLAAFRAKLSRALLDRFDLVVTVPRPRSSELAAGAAEGSDAVRGRVVAARERLAGAPLRRTEAADELLSRAVDRLPLSARGRARVARVARTAAALAGADAVLPEHVAEALAYRSPAELTA